MTEKKRIYIAGAGGMLGEAFYKQFREEYDLTCSDIDVNDSWLEWLDFRDYEKYREAVKRSGASFLFHLGAHTSLEYCELHPDDAHVTNTLGVEHAVSIANELAIPLLYISTAGIFDGKKDLYDDWDQPNPLGQYARTKYAGELFVINNCRRYLVCRAGWMMGGGPKKDKKFIQKLMAQLKEGKKELFIVNDKLGTPTYTHDFAANVKVLLQKEYWGLYNIVCEGITGRLEVTEELIRILGLQNDITIIPVSSDHFKQTYFAERPASERLINKKLTQKEVNLMHDWKTCLETYIGEYYKGYL
ncbi:MAG: sugar nucleotide-binding protein [Chitinophagaceae bacterium]